MRRLAWLSVIAFAALAAAGGIAYSSGNPGAPAGQNRVYGGGRICVNESCTNIRDFSVDVHANPAAHTVVGDFATARDIDGVVVTAVDSADITCTKVEGKKAVIGGIVRTGSPPQVIGVAFVMYFVDNGPPSSPVDDIATPPFFVDPGDPFPGQPEEFPWVCPASVDVFNPALNRDLQSGDVAVEDAR
jgi:hypothetical protein